MRLYKRIELVKGVPVQFLAVYAPRWGKVVDPSDGFIEATEEEMQQAARDNPVEGGDGCLKHH